MAKEVGSGGVEQKGDEKVNERRLISKPSARLVDLTYQFSETCGGRETQGRVNSNGIQLGDQKGGKPKHEKKWAHEI